MCNERDGKRKTWEVVCCWCISPPRFILKCRVNIDGKFCFIYPKKHAGDSHSQSCESIVLIQTHTDVFTPASAQLKHTTSHRRGTSTSCSEHARPKHLPQLSFMKPALQVCRLSDAQTRAHKHGWTWWAFPTTGGRGGLIHSHHARLLAALRRGPSPLGLIGWTNPIKDRWFRPLFITWVN